LFQKYLSLSKADVQSSVVWFVVQRLPATIGGLKQLRVLDLEENKLDLLPADIGE